MNNVQDCTIFSIELRLDHWVSRFFARRELFFQNVNNLSRGIETFGGGDSFTFLNRSQIRESIARSNLGKVASNVGESVSGYVRIVHRYGSD